MQHLERYRTRETRVLGLANGNGWRLKRYVIVAPDRRFDATAVEAATKAALVRLPPAGTLDDADSNHGIGVQIFHFAEQVPLTSHVFYWKWGSVLFNSHQMRSYSEEPYEIVDGVSDVVGCVWEMELVNFEVQAWRDIVLSGGANPVSSVAQYLEAHAR